MNRKKQGCWDALQMWTYHIYLMLEDKKGHICTTIYFLLYLSSLTLIYQLKQALNLPLAVHHISITLTANIIVTILFARIILQGYRFFSIEINKSATPLNLIMWKNPDLNKTFSQSFVNQCITRKEGIKACASQN